MAEHECPGCKQWLSSRVDMCPQCGYPVQIPRQPVDVDPARLTARPWISQIEGWAGVAGLVLIIIGLAASSPAAWAAGIIVVLVAVLVRVTRRRGISRGRSDASNLTS